MATLGQKERRLGDHMTVAGENATGVCNIVSVGKRRDGGTRYWCLEHRADATAKYGKRAPHCRYAHVQPILPNEVVTIDINAYQGGVGIWGAVPPVYDTTTKPLDRGIHVHARKLPNGNKDIDATYRRVHLRRGSTLTDVEELDAIYFMVSEVFNKEPQEVICTHCKDSHLDKDWFSVHPHRSHLCAACGKHFRDEKTAVGNPVARVTSTWSGVRACSSSKEVLDLRQNKYAGGIQIWGSNPAIVWTVPKQELLGIHVHAHVRADGLSHPDDIDETFGTVVIDGVTLDPESVRNYMAQMALPHLSRRIVAASCEGCGALAFDRGDAAFTPEVRQACERCGGRLEVQGRLRKVIANPFVAAIQAMGLRAVRSPRLHDLGLLPETL